MIELAILVAIGFLFHMVKEGIQSIIEILETLRDK
jgi:hypothetical protein